MSAPLVPLPAGEIQFFDAFTPGLKDGTYRIDVAQTLTAADAAIPPVSQQFIVQGPRFTLDPADVHMVFPPKGATSAFEGVLPHLVLTKRLLPWERHLPGLAPGNAVPWLALLVFSEGELLGDPAGGTYAQPLTVGQLLDAAPDTRKPALDPQAVMGDERALACQAITITSALFAQIVPTARELPYLTHAREVNTGHKANFGLKDDGWFSVVVANRFPQAGTAAAAQKSIVHLVSLEGFGDLLGGTQPVAPAQPRIQLVSLANWTFSCLANPAQTFGGLAQHLAYDSSDNFALRPASSLVLRLPFAPTGATGPGTAVVQQRLQGGYVALGYHAASGEDGFAWYRGPCAAVVSNRVPGATAFATADAAMIYDPATGVFDLSLATAWQAGCSLALANEPFATALMRLRIAANATLEQAAAPSSTAVHAQLARLFGAGAIDRIAAGSTGGVPPLARPPAAAVAAARRPAPAAALRALLARPAVQSQLGAQVQASPDARTVTDTLGQWRLLRNVPFVHLVPDARMLPADSIRFFYLDPNWLDALVAGALSVGLATSRESAVQAALTQQLGQMAQAAALAWRANQSSQPPLSPPAGPTAGFLLRSALASGWPGLTVTATAGGTPVPLLRLEHVGSNVLLALFNGVPDTVVLGEPQEGLEFGVDDAGEVDTRTITPATGAKPPVIQNGRPVRVFDPANPSAPSVTIRAGAQRVLNVSTNPNPPTSPPMKPLDLVESLAQALNLAPSRVGPANFGVQMVKGPEQLVFSLTPPAKPA